MYQKRASNTINSTELFTAAQLKGISFDKMLISLQVVFSSNVTVYIVQLQNILYKDTIVMIERFININKQCETTAIS